MRELVIIAYLSMHLFMALAAATALIYGVLYLIRCINIARRRNSKRKSIK